MAGAENQDRKFHSVVDFAKKIVVNFAKWFNKTTTFCVCGCHQLEGGSRKLARTELRPVLTNYESLTD